MPKIRRVFAAMVILCEVLIGACRSKTGNADIVPNSIAQQTIENLTIVIQELGRGTKSRTDDEAFALLDQLKRSVGGDQKALLQQLTYYLSQTPDERQAYGMLAILHFLKPAMSDILSAILPVIDTPNTKLRNAVYYFLAYIAEGGGGKSFDYSAFDPVLRERKHNPPLGLIRFMYEARELGNSPVLAATTLSHVYVDDPQERDNLIAELQTVQRLRDEIQQAPMNERERLRRQFGDQLAGLAQRSEWWVQLYVASTLRRWEYRADPTIKARLLVASHPLVREFAKEIKPAEAPTEENTTP
jgi:hypothetical protein